MISTAIKATATSNTAWIVSAWAIVQSIIAGNPGWIDQYPNLRTWATGAIMVVAGLVKAGQGVLWLRNELHKPHRARKKGAK